MERVYRNFTENFDHLEKQVVVPNKMYEEIRKRLIENWSKFVKKKIHNLSISSSKSEP